MKELHACICHILLVIMVSDFMGRIRTVWIRIEEETQGWGKQCAKNSKRSFFSISKTKSKNHDYEQILNEVLFQYNPQILCKSVQGMNQMPRIIYTKSHNKSFGNNQANSRCLSCLPLYPKKQACEQRETPSKTILSAPQERLQCQDEDLTYTRLFHL